MASRDIKVSPGDEWKVIKYIMDMCLNSDIITGSDILVLQLAWREPVDKKYVRKAMLGCIAAIITSSVGYYLTEDVQITTLLLVPIICFTYWDMKLSTLAFEAMTPFEELIVNLKNQLVLNKDIQDYYVSRFRPIHKLRLSGKMWIDVNKLTMDEKEFNGIFGQVFSQILNTMQSLSLRVKNPPLDLVNPFGNSKNSDLHAHMIINIQKVDVTMIQLEEYFMKYKKLISFFLSSMVLLLKQCIETKTAYKSKINSDLLELNKIMKKEIDNIKALLMELRKRRAYDLEMVANKRTDLAGAFELHI